MTAHPLPGGPVEIVRQGDVFASGADVLVNPVNCVGIMGAGLALQFKHRFPEMFARYAAACARGEYTLGIPEIDRLQTPVVVNFPTKLHWQSVSALAPIVEGLLALRHFTSDWRDLTMAMPALGCGHGQLPWSTVKPYLVRFAEMAPYRVVIYAPVVLMNAPLPRGLG